MTYLNHKYDVSRAQIMLLPDHIKIEWKWHLIDCLDRLRAIGYDLIFKSTMDNRHEIMISIVNQKQELIKLFKGHQSQRKLYESLVEYIQNDPEIQRRYDLRVFV